MCFPPRRAVHHKTSTLLTSVFEMGTGDPHHYGRPNDRNRNSFIKVTFIPFRSDGGCSFQDVQKRLILIPTVILIVRNTKFVFFLRKKRTVKRTVKICPFHIFCPVFQKKRTLENQTLISFRGNVLFIVLLLLEVDLSILVFGLFLLFGQVSCPVINSFL